jgi:hypothetical protein
MELPPLSWRDAKHQFCRRWDRAIGHPGYSKRAWLDAEATIFRYAPEAFMVRDSGLSSSGRTGVQLDIWITDLTS